MRPRVGAVGEAREPKGCGVDQGRIAGDHVGHQLAGARSDAEAVAGKPSRDKESRQALDRRDHRDRVGHDVDHAAPAFRNDRVAEHREGLGGGVARAIDDEAVGFGIKYPHRLERRSLVQTPTPRHAPFLDPATAHSEPQLLPMQPHRRKIVEEQSEMVGYEVDRANPEGRDGVAAVHPLAEAEEATRGGNLRTALERLGPHYRGKDPELRGLYAASAGKDARPGAAAARRTEPQPPRPLAVPTAATRPAAVSRPRTAHLATIAAPCRRAASAIAGAGLCGWAWPALGG